jgi:hypothetical protein
MIDIIILTYTKNSEYYEMVLRCITSYLKEEQYINNIILVESNKDFDNSIWKNISNKIISVVPPYDFNYNKFLNIALTYCTSEFICISNNDVITKPKCLENMVFAFNKINTLMSASPVDRSWHRNTYNDFPEDNTLYFGYETTKFLLGFCLFMRKQVFDIIGKFDERFDFYFQDNDYERCLQANKLPHALNTASQIEHGLNKPESEETSDQVRKKLLDAQEVFYRKWNTEGFTKIV